MNIAIPLLCVLVFLLTLLIITLFPSRPTRFPVKEIDFMEPLTKQSEPLELNNVERVKKSNNKSSSNKDNEIKSAIV